MKQTNNKFIQDILNDLYQLDQSLMKHEKEIINTIKKMIALKPDSKFSDEFKDNLKNTILAAIKSDWKSSSAPSPLSTSGPRRTLWARYAVSSVLVASFALFVVVPYFNDWVSPVTDLMKDDYFNTDVYEQEEDEYSKNGSLLQNLLWWVASSRPKNMGVNTPTESMALDSVVIEESMAWWIVVWGWTSSSMAMEKRSFDAEDTIWFTVGADQDIQLFRENIANWHIPNPDVITYNGIFSDYHFDLPEWKCESTFCPLVAGAEVNGESRVQIWLWSNITESSFKRSPTNFVFVIDRSWSMDIEFDSYYYDNNIALFDDEWTACSSNETYFRPNQKCVSQWSKSKYEKDYRIAQGKTKMELAMESLSKMLDKLQPDDRVSIVLFDNNAQVAHPLIKVSDINIDKLQNHILRIKDGWGTNMEAGMELWLAQLDEFTNEDWYQNRIIFMTDAMPNIGNDSPYSLAGMVKKAAKDNIYFSFLWVWVDFQQQFIQKLAKYEGANYFFISDARDFQKRVVEEFDYNFFPMIFDLDFTIDQPELIDDVYGSDFSNSLQWEVFHINTLFPTPPTDSGHRWSIILLKLKDALTSDLTLNVWYTTIEWHELSQTVKLEKDDFNKNPTIEKAILLVQYADTLWGHLPTSCSCESQGWLISHHCPW